MANGFGNKALIGVLAAAVVAGAGYFVYRQYKARKLKEDSVAVKAPTVNVKVRSK